MTARKDANHLPRAHPRSVVTTADELQPEEDENLTDKHTDGGGRHAKGHADEDGDEDHFDGGAKDHAHAGEEAFVVVVSVMVGAPLVTKGFELDVGGEFHDAIRATVGDCVRALVFMMVVRVVAGELVDTFHAEAFYLAGCALGGGFGFVDAGDELGEDAAHHVGAFGVWGVGGGGDGSDGVEGKLMVIISIMEVCNSSIVREGFTLPSASLMTLISMSSTVTISPSRPMMVMRIVTRLFSSNFCSLYSML